MMKHIEKIWGWEKIIVNNELYCVKFIHIKDGYRNSMQYHKNKDETFFILGGKMLLEIGEGDTHEEMEMLPGDTYRIKPNTLHRYSGIEDATFLEISTHFDIEDTYQVIKGGKISE